MLGSPFSSLATDTVAALGEGRLIARIQEWLGSATPPAPHGLGDDCAVLPVLRKPPLITVDPVIYGVHFDEGVSARAAGQKLFKRNLSDIAAMGGRPRSAVVALALDSRTRVRWLAEFYRGLAAVSRAYRVPIVGGDVAQMPAGFAATLTLLGEAHGSRVLTRVGARVGDAIYVTGTLGGSRSGHHWRFTPRLAEGAWLARQPEVRSMLDLSDGLAKDLPALTPPGTEASLAPDTLPISPTALRLARAGGETARQRALTDGEDYELLFTVDGKADQAAWGRRWRRAFPRVRLTRLGQFVRTGHAAPGSLSLSDYQGFEHLRPR